MTQLTDNIYAVEIPEDAYDVEIVGDGLDFIYYRIPITGTFEKSKGKLIHISTTGSYTLLFLSKEATEDDYKKVVERVSGWMTDIYYDYCANGRDYRDIVDAAFCEPVKSFHSLLQSRGLDPSKNYAIIKKNDV